jgi:aminoglycoside phosphotransferase (APT) family kinase protein
LSIHEAIVALEANSPDSRRRLCHHPRMGTRDFVALVHDGRVLLDSSDRLPCIAMDDGYPTYVELLALVGGDRFISPAVRIAPDVYVHTAEVDGHIAPDGRWVSLTDLSDDPDVTAAVVRAAREYVGEAPTQRCEWFRPGWFERVDAWVDEALGSNGRRRTGATEVQRRWSQSAVLRIPAGSGDVWFKATCEHFHGEPAITRVLAAHFSDLMPVVLAEDDDLVWLLMEPLAGAGHSRAPGADRVLAPRFVELQIASVALRDELLAAGCPDRGLKQTLRGFRGVLAESVELPRLTEPEVSAVREAAAEIEARVEEFWACGLPDTLSHGDLHLGNVAYDGSQLRVFDWTDSCLSHPFLDGAHLARFNAESGGDDGPPDEAVAAIFADRWRAERPEADVDRALALAPAGEPGLPGGEL